MILGSEINDQSRAAGNRSGCSGLKIVGCDCARDMKIEMCVSVNKAREDILACAVDFSGIRVTYVCVHSHNFLMLDQEICVPGALAGDNDAAF